MSKLYSSAKPIVANTSSQLTVQHNPDLTNLSKKLLEKLWEKEKMLVTNNFSVFHNVYNPAKEKKEIIILTNFISCKIALNLDQMENFF